MGGRIGYDDECIERTVLTTKPFGGWGSQNKQSPYVLTGQKVQVARSVPGSDSRVQPDIIMSHRNVHAHQHKCGSLLPTREYIDETDGVRQPTSVLDLTKKGVGGGITGSVQMLNGFSMCLCARAYCCAACFSCPAKRNAIEYEESPV